VSSAAPPGATRVRILVYNVRGFRDGADAVGAVVRRLEPDLVLLNETGGRRRLRRFARSVGMEVAGDPWSPLRRRVKDAILVRPPWRILEPGQHRFAGSARWYPRGVLLARVVGPDATISVAVTHLGLRASERRRHAAELLRLLDSMPEPVVVGGDLNELPDRGAPASLAERYRDAWVIAGQGDGPTFPADVPTARIDYLFVSGGVRVERVAVPGEPDVRTASDHRPLLADLAVPMAGEAASANP
jgi:endonuclease/exonuclease/phosphatase family metal-dependent hydrolase